MQYDKMIEEIERFREYLRTYTDIAESSIKLYCRTIKRFYNQHDDLNLDNINKFISDGFRESRSNYIKYTFKYYLKFVKREGWYKKLVKVKVRSRIRFGSYHDKEMIMKIIKNIHDEKYRDMSYLQYALGARARGIITIKEENIYFEESPIRLILIEKGDKEAIKFLSESYRPLIKKYMRNKPGFIFLDDRYNLSEDWEIDTAINTQRTYMYNHIQESIEELGIPNFGTHDFRRNVVDGWVDEFGVHVAKDAAGHSSVNTTMKYKNKKAIAPVMNAMLKHQGEINDTDIKEEENDIHID